MIPHPTTRPSQPVHRNGLFAAPWAHEPVLPRMETRAAGGCASVYAAPSPGLYEARRDDHRSPVAVGGPDQMDFMSAIREQAVFAWALTGINGCLAEFGHGRPTGEALPRDGLPIWSHDPNQQYHSRDDPYSSGYRDGPAVSGSESDGRTGAQFFGDPGLDRNSNRSLSSHGSNGKSSSHTLFPPRPR